MSLGDREEKLWGPEKSIEMPKEIMEALKECTHGNYLIAFGTGVAQSKKNQTILEPHQEVNSLLMALCPSPKKSQQFHCSSF